MKVNVIGLFFLLEYCICDSDTVRNFDGGIQKIVVGNNSKLYVLTDQRMHQLKHDLSMEKSKTFNGSDVTLLVAFEANGTLIRCGTSDGGNCEVLDLNDITNSIYKEKIWDEPQENEKSIAFIVETGSQGAYMLVGMKEDSTKVPFCMVTLWNTLDSQPGNIFSKSGEGTIPCIQTNIRDVEFIDGFHIISLKLSYLFLNAKTESGWQANVLRLNNAKGRKNDILRDFNVSRLNCCSDKARPVLLASALIPSDKAVLWTGVFSAQNENDPENTALAVYNISNVDGKVKIFCDTDRCKELTQIQPIAEVFKYKSMSSVTAVVDGSWIVLFIGTSDGQLIKLVLDERFIPGCPTVLFRSDVDQEVLPVVHLDPIDSKYIYIALKNQIRRVLVVQCDKYNTLKDCRDALEPFCGWCGNKNRCSTKNECSNSPWMTFSKNSIQKQLLSFQVSKKSLREITLKLTLGLESTQNPVFSCKFTAGGVNLCDRSTPAEVFPNCSCTFPDQLLSTASLEVLATASIGNQKITETLMLMNCSSITDPLKSSYTQYFQCVSAGCHWSSSLKRCDWAHGPEEEIHIKDVRKDDTERYNKKPEILSIKPNKVSFHGKNSVLLTGRNLESVTKIRIQSNMECISKEAPVFNRFSDSLKFHIPPSKNKGTAKVCVVTEDGRCYGNSIITYSSQPNCEGIQPKVTWKSGGRKIQVQGTNIKFVESIIVLPTREELKIQEITNSKDLWFYSDPHNGLDQMKLMLKVGNSTLHCADLIYQPDPEFTGFIATQINDYIHKKADELNLNMNEVKVSGLQEDQEYECVLETMVSYAIICTINAVIQVDSLTIRVGSSIVLRMGQSSTKYVFCLKP